MLDCKKIINGYDYYHTKMLTDDCLHFTSLNSFVAAAGVGFELDFYLGGVRWCLEPAYDNRKGPGDGKYILGKDNGEWMKVFPSLAKALEFDYNGKHIPADWPEIKLHDSL